jgi:hypothetical protein
MILTNTTHLRGNIKSFTFKHASSKLGKINIDVNAINEENAQRKVWGEVRKMYKQAKKAKAA